jgi:alcohol dehydrogenase-like protein
LADWYLGLKSIFEFRIALVSLMKAAVLTRPAPVASSPLKIEDVPIPALMPGQVLLRVRACGVCRTDLHIVEGELTSLHPRIIPGHQIVGDGQAMVSRPIRGLVSLGLAAPMAPVLIAVEGWKTCATRRPSPVIQ